jgi:hypothetical protein
MWGVCLYYIYYIKTHIFYGTPCVRKLVGGKSFVKVLSRVLVTIDGVLMDE